MAGGAHVGDGDERGAQLEPEPLRAPRPQRGERRAGALLLARGERDERAVAAEHVRQLVAAGGVLDRPDDRRAREVDLLVAARADRPRRVDDVGDGERPAVRQRAVVRGVDDAVEGVEGGSASKKSADSAMAREPIRPRNDDGPPGAGRRPLGAARG